MGSCPEELAQAALAGSWVGSRWVWGMACPEEASPQHQSLKAGHAKEDHPVGSQLAEESREANLVGVLGSLGEGQAACLHVRQSWSFLASMTVSVDLPGGGGPPIPGAPGGGPIPGGNPDGGPPNPGGGAPKPGGPAGF